MPKGHEYETPHGGRWKKATAYDRISLPELRKLVSIYNKEVKIKGIWKLQKIQIARELEAAKYEITEKNKKFELRPTKNPQWKPIIPPKKEKVSAAGSVKITKAMERRAGERDQRRYWGSAPPSKEDSAKIWKAHYDALRQRRHKRVTRKGKEWDEWFQEKYGKYGTPEKMKAQLDKDIERTYANRMKLEKKQDEAVRKAVEKKEEEEAQKEYERYIKKHPEGTAYDEEPKEKKKVPKKLKIKS